MPNPLSLSSRRARVCALAVAGLTTAAFVVPQAASADRAVPRSVPTPSADSSVVTVKVGGDRTGPQSVGPLAGVRLALFAEPENGPPVDVVWAVCTSDADGDCSFVVPDTGTGQANEGRRFWVGQVPDGVPAGWYTNPRLRVGPGSGSNSQDPAYVFQTPAMAGGTTYSSTVSGPDGFMLSSTYGTNYTASGGVWQNSRNNPRLPAQCGTDVALVLDLSASVGSALPQLKEAANTFADALTGTPSRMAVFSFDQASPSTSVAANHPELQSVSTKAGATAFKNLYADWTLGKGTNWDQGLWAVAQAAEHYEAVIVLTDGNPTRFADNAQGDGSNTHFRDVENGIFSANAVKAEGSRVVALGVGRGVEGVSALNLRALSGPTAYDGTNPGGADYYQTADFAAAGQQLRDLAMAQCKGSISVVKQIVPAGTTGEDVTGAVNAGPGWTFDASTATPGIGGMPATETTTDDGTGSVAFQPSFNAVDHGVFTVAETQHPDYELVTQNGRNAVCTDLGTGNPVDVTNTGSAGNPGFSLGLDASQAVSCVLYNRTVQAADVTVDKTWRINGTAYAQGTQPDGFDASLTLTGPGGAGATSQPWGTPRTGYRVGEQATAAETVRLADGCTLDSSRVTSVDGEPTDFPLPHTAEVRAAHLRMGITNTVTCTQPTPSPTATPSHTGKPTPTPRPTPTHTGKPTPTHSTTTPTPTHTGKPTPTHTHPTTHPTPTATPTPTSTSTVPCSETPTWPSKTPTGPAPSTSSPSGPPTSTHPSRSPDATPPMTAHPTRSGFPWVPPADPGTGPEGAAGPGSDDGPGAGPGNGHLAVAGASAPLGWLAGSAAAACLLGGAALILTRRRRG
ncbi:vWA domain-containing protein [Uniformispora flossi]|uniref:vWA domain-containing protein n=1 Tax=Uniformispora flossi TaxID=3390723 RepID=UPI003C2C62D0